MSYTSKEDALQLAAVNLEVDSAKYIRRIEAEIANWDGKKTMVIVIQESDITVGQTLAEMYKAEGWTTSFKKGATNARFWTLTLS